MPRLDNWPGMVKASAVRQLRWVFLLEFAVASSFALSGDEALASHPGCTVFQLALATVQNAAFTHAPDELAAARRDRLKWLERWIAAVDAVTRSSVAGIDEVAMLRKAAVMQPELIRDGQTVHFLAPDSTDDLFLFGLVRTRVTLLASGVGLLAPFRGRGEVDATARRTFLARGYSDLVRRHPNWREYFPKALASESIFIHYFEERLRLLPYGGDVDALGLRADVVLSFWPLSNVQRGPLQLTPAVLVQRAVAPRGIVWGAGDGLLQGSLPGGGELRRLDAGVRLNMFLSSAPESGSAQGDSWEDFLRGGSPYLWAATSLNTRRR